MDTDSRTVSGDMIKAFRRVTKTSREDLSRHLGIPITTLMAYEKNGAPEAMRYALLGLGLAEGAASKRELRELLNVPRHVPRPTILSTDFHPMGSERVAK